MNDCPVVGNYTLFLQEIQIQPYLSDQKIFRGKDRYVLQQKVFEYIEEKYPNRYKIRTTLYRLIGDCIRNNAGMTIQQERMAILSGKYSYADLLGLLSESEADEEITARYEFLCNEVKEWWSKEYDKILLEVRDTKKRKVLFDRIDIQRAERIMKLEREENNERNKIWRFY